jgi:chromosome partitioning protein
MKVIVLASSKGGVGKTTLAFNLAVHAARSGTGPRRGVGVQLIDRDPQRSLMNLCHRRRDTPELQADNPMLLDNVATVASTIADLADSGYARDYLIVDTPGSLMTVLHEALAAADAVIVPLQASPLDVAAQDAVLDMVERLGKRDRLLFVINRVDGRSGMVADTLRKIASRSPHRPLQIANRTDYARAAVTARAAVEVNAEAAREIATLWTAVTRVIERAEHDRHVQRKSGRSAKIQRPGDAGAARPDRAPVDGARPIELRRACGKGAGCR